MEHTIWFVDEAVAENGAEAATVPVLRRLADMEIILPTLRIGKESYQKSLYPPGPDARMHTRGGQDVSGLYRGLLVCTERTIFHAGGNGLDALQCPNCNAIHPVESIPWSEAVQTWWDRTSHDELRCVACQQTASISRWHFCVDDMKGGFTPCPWAFGNLGFGFWNWPIEDRIGDEIAAVLGRPVKVVYQAI